MPQLKLDLKIDDIESLIFQLPAEQFILLADAIVERAETLGIMKLSETGFKEWDEEGEGIYDDA